VGTLRLVDGIRRRHQVNGKKGSVPFSLDCATNLDAATSYSNESGLIAVKFDFSINSSTGSEEQSLTISSEDAEQTSVDLDKYHKDPKLLFNGALNVMADDKSATSRGRFDIF
jgi:hypothetical protein